ncbi:MAG: universal stress protein [Steroidobacteraceae bacterium]|jgi:universal stress protein E
MSEYQVNRILVAIADPSTGLNKAVRRARALAHQTGAAVDLFNAISSSVSTGTLHAESEQFTRLEAEQNRRLLERTANRLRREEIVVNTKVETGYPVHEAILRAVRLAKADLLIIEARKHNVFARLLLTQTDFELIRHCPVPLLIVKRQTAWRRPRILAALDPFHIHDKPTGLDSEIAGAALAIASMVGGSVHATHIYRPLVGFVPDLAGATALTTMPETDNKYKATVRRRFYEAVDRYGIAKNKAHLVCGDPAVALPAVARSTRAGLIVMGAMSRSGLKRIFIGNTAERVLDGLQCDVLVVKPK